MEKILLKITESFKKFFLTSLMITMMLNLVASLQAYPIHLTLLFTGDTHGQITPFWNHAHTQQWGGVSRRMTLIRQIQNEVGKNHVLLLDSGGIFQGTALSHFTQGQAVYSSYQTMGYQAVVLGNHDYDYGEDFILHLKDALNFPWLSSNAIMPAYSHNFVKPFILEYKGVRIAILGLTNPHTNVVTGFNRTQGLRFDSPWQVAAGLHAILIKNADFFIGLTDLSLSQLQQVAHKDTFFSVIIGGRSHRILKKPICSQEADGQVTSPILVETGNRGRYLGRLDLTLTGSPENGFRVQYFHYRMIPINDHIVPDAKLQTMVQASFQKLPIGIHDPLTVSKHYFKLSNTSESVIGHLTAEAMKKMDQGQIACINSAAFRGGIPQGTITRENLYHIFPFSYKLTTLEISGYDLQRLLDATFFQRGTGAFLQVAGMTIKDDHKNLLVSINGNPLNDHRYYKMITSDYLAQGNGGYAFLKTIHQIPNAAAVTSIRRLIEKKLQSSVTFSAQNSDNWIFGKK